MDFLTTVKTWYDTVISSQADFEEWYNQLDAETYKGESVLILSGTYSRSDGKGLHLPTTLKQLHGLGQVTISTSSYAGNSDNAFIYYTTKPSGKGYSIRNISVYVRQSGTYEARAFRNCINLELCNAECQGPNSQCTTFSECTNLINCSASGSAIHSYYGFYNCTDLINCTCSSANPSGYGFFNCTRLVNCTGDVKNGLTIFYNCKDISNCEVTIESSTYTGKGFYGCNKLTNCTVNSSSSKAVCFDTCSSLTNCVVTAGSQGANTTGFKSCSICSNCSKQAGAPVSPVWTGTNTNISKDTCPEYTG